MAYVAAFRAYYWNEDVAALARRFFAACPSGRHVVLADETKGRLPIENYEVISHTEDLGDLGLPNHPVGSSLWYNVDYGAYVLRKALPDFDHYVLAESDLATNLELEPMLAAVAARELDWVVHDLRLPGPDWYWRATGTEVFAEVWAALLFFMVLSGRAVDLLLAARQRQVPLLADGKISRWPFCEAFVPSVLKRTTMNYAAVAEFADTRNLSYRPRIQLSDPRANRSGALVHSVLGRRDFIAAMIKDQPPGDWFMPTSDLRRGLAEISFDEIWPVLLERFETTVDHAGRAAFREQIIAHGVTLERNDDLAYCKPAIQSSVCEWSRSTDPRVEAGGANGVVLHEDYGFHTLFEPNPWWAVDLLDSYVIDEVSILNRRNSAARFRTFAIQTSLDGNTWVTRFLKMDLTDVSADPAAPLRISFTDPPFARHIRITMLGTTALHLRRVSVFGRALAKPASAPATPPRNG